MFLGLAILLVLIWLGAFVIFHVSGFLIHVLILLAVISLIMHLFVGRRTT